MDDFWGDKPHTNEDTIRGGPTLRTLSVLGTGQSARLPREQFTSEFIKNHATPKKLSTGAINSST